MGKVREYIESSHVLPKIQALITARDSTSGAERECFFHGKIDSNTRQIFINIHTHSVPNRPVQESDEARGLGPKKAV